MGQCDQHIALLSVIVLGNANYPVAYILLLGDIQIVRRHIFLVIFNPPLNSARFSRRLHLSK